ncbi:MAG: DUF58 domain-containing protein [Candidatus Riflebacteria bacterium]|nr:DUF58 domain-containing protein [Candidatus Riflebacteria bacterium]
MLFDLKFFKNLKLLHIITKKHFRGEKIGHRKSPQRGASIEFAEYKDYTPGDDLRFIDWNLYGRLETLYIKKFHNEEELTVSVLLDTSDSMNFGKPAKFDHARKLAAAISYIAMQHQDTARVYSFARGLDAATENGFRPGHIHRIMGFLENRVSKGQSTNFEETVTHFILKNRRPGVVFILTDAMFGTDLAVGLKKLFHRRFEVNLVHILAPEEITPDLAGLVELSDIEDSSKVTLQINKQALTIYEEVLKETIDELRKTLIGMRMRYQQSITSTPFESTMLDLFSNMHHRS